MAAFIGYFTDLAAIEAKYAAKVEKVNKKYIPAVSEYRYDYFSLLPFLPIRHHTTYGLLISPMTSRSMFEIEVKPRAVSSFVTA